MINQISYLTLWSYVLIVTSASSIYSQGWAVNIVGECRQSCVMSPVGPYEPCNYTLNFDHYSAVISIVSTNMSKYIFKRVYEDNTYSLTRKSIQYQGQDMVLSLHMSLQNGVAYTYTAQIMKTGLFLSTTKKINEISTLMKAFIFMVIGCIFMPLKKNKLLQTLQDIKTRTCLLSVLMFSQIAMTISITSALTTIQYVIYEPNYFFKIFYYLILGPCFLLFLVQAIFITSIIQNQMNLQQKTEFKYVASSMIMLVSVLCYPFFIALFEKGVSYFYIQSLGIIIDLLWAYFKQHKPYTKFVVLNGLSILFLAIFTDSYPALNFYSLSIVQLMYLVIWIVVIFYFTALVIRKTKNIQNTENIFQLNNIINQT